MSFTKHVKERAAKNVLKKQRFRVWLVWSLILMLVFSALTLPLLGLFSSPFVFGIACLLFLAPAVCRARSLTEPILYPATTLMPTRASLLGLGPESRPASCFYTFSLSIRILAVVVIYYTYSVARYSQVDTLDPEKVTECCLETYWEAKSACEHLLSAHRSCYANGYELAYKPLTRSIYVSISTPTNDSDAYWNLDLCNQLLEDPNCTSQMLAVLPALVGNDSGRLDWSTACVSSRSSGSSLFSFVISDIVRTSRNLDDDDDDCFQSAAAASACADHPLFTRRDDYLSSIFPYDPAPGCNIVDPDMLERLCATFSQLPQYLFCDPESLLIMKYAHCRLLSKSWFQGSGWCDTLGLLDRVTTPQSERYLGYVEVPAFFIILGMVAVSPLVAIVVLMISCFASSARIDVDADIRADVDTEIERLQKKLDLKEKPAKNENVAVRADVDKEIQRLQEELDQKEKMAKNDVDVDGVRAGVDEEIQESKEEIDKKEKAANRCQTCVNWCWNCMNMVEPVLLRADLVLVFMDIVGDIAAVFTWMSTGHGWFGIFQILIILRGVPAMVRLQREKGLMNEVRDSLKANTLTDGLYDLMLQEKTVEGVYTSLLLAYGIMHTLDSRLAFYLTMAKWALSIRSMTNGCFIQFHLAPGDVETGARPLLATLPAWPLGRRYHLETE